MNSRFRIGKTTYEAAAMGRVTLRQAMRFQRSTADLGEPMTWQQAQHRVGMFFDELEAAKTKQEKDALGLTHPDFILTIAIIVWAARLAVEADLLWEDALEVDLNEIEWLEARATPSDHRPPKDPRAARPGSGRAGGGAASTRRKKTSRKR